MKREIDYYDTFVTNNGNLNERIKNSTNLNGQEQLLKRMDNRSANSAVDVLLENGCSQHCISCYFQENGGGGAISVTPEVIDDVNQMIKVLMPEDPDLFMFYPREISTSPQLLSVYTRQGMDRVLTNGKLLHKEGIIKKLKDAGIKRMSITVPGCKEAFSIYTKEPENGYDQLLSNISLAVNSGFSVSIFMPVFKQNQNDVMPTILDLYSRGVKDIKFLRVVPEGQAKELGDDMFLSNDEILKFLRTVNEARHLVGKEMSLGLFTGYFGPNFYTNNVFKYLSGEKAVWPKSKYFCPMLTNQYVGISVASRSAYSCFAALSFPDEFRVGEYQNGKITSSSSTVNINTLDADLRGLCSSKNCEEQPICMGGCRLIPFSIAKRKGEPLPMTAGQDFCITHALREIAKQKS